MSVLSTSPRLALLGLGLAAIASAVWLVDSAVEAQTTPRDAATSSSRDLANWNANSSVVASSHGAAPINPTPTTQPLADAPLVKVEKPNVLIVSIDGLRPDCMLRADAPNLRALMSRGSFTLWARTTDIAITTPSHISMLTGVTPERHGISFNADPPDDARILVPTIFDYARERGLSTGMASGKRKFVLFTRTGNVDYSAVSKEVTAKDGPVGTWAEEIITKEKPRVMFVHFAGADVAGHGIGWGTPQQIAAISGIDKALGGVLHAYESAGLMDHTYIIVSADHGGTARSHGKDDLRSHFIPWIFVGPGVRANYDLTQLGKAYDIATFDTFATASYVVGIPVSPDSDGKPILAAFSDYDLLGPVEPTTKAAAGTTTSPTDLPTLLPTTAPSN